MNDQLDRHDLIQRLSRADYNEEKEDLISTITALSILCICCGFLVYVVLAFEAQIDKVGIQPDRSTVILHETRRGER